MSAPEQHFAFQNPYALEVRFDGLFLVEKEPRGDGEEDDDVLGDLDDPDSDDMFSFDMSMDDDDEI